MIPRKIHYCWFGRAQKPRLAIRCIESWKKFCPDFEIIEWNEDNFDVNQNAYSRYCYENKKWAFLSDYVRLAVVAKYGGVYFDTDVEAVRNIDDLLNYDAFYGFENENCVNTGLGFGSVAGHAVISQMLAQYESKKPNENGAYPLVGCPALNTAALDSFGLVHNGELQNVAGAEILPADYLNPYDDATGRLNKTANTVSIHWYSKSALSKWKIWRSRLTRPLHRLLGKDFFARFR